MSNTLTRIQEFTRVPNGLSVRKVIKAKDVHQTPEYQYRQHVLGSVSAALELFPKDVIRMVQEKLGVVLK
jgi:hypothetical protein